MKLITWDKPAIEHPDIIPMIRIWMREKDMMPHEAVDLATAKFDTPPEQWALADQPPEGKHSYTSRFGTIYNELGLQDGAFHLRAWLEACFQTLKARGYPCPVFMPLDWEGYWSIKVEGQQWHDRKRMDRLARLRANALSFCVWQPAMQVWGQPIEASNYEDRPGMHGFPIYSKEHGAVYPAIGLTNVASPVFYRFRSWMDDERMHYDPLINANAATGPMRPWIAGNDVASLERLRMIDSVDMVIGWEGGEGVKSTLPLQEAIAAWSESNGQ